MTLEEFYRHLESRKSGQYLIPRFDFMHGATIDSKILFLLESPGPQVRKSGLISLFNNDPSASNLRKQLEEAKAPLNHILLWNIVPWMEREGTGFKKPTAPEISEAREYNLLLFDVFQKLTTIVFIGRTSQREIPFYSGHSSHRLLAAHHPGAQAMSVKQRRTENVAVFQRLITLPSADQK